MGEVVHQAGMEQRSGFEPPLSVWRTDVLPLHKRCEFCGDTVGGAPVRMATDLHSGLARRQPLPRRFRIPFDDTPRIFAAHAGTRTNHGTFQPCAGTSVASVHLYKAGASQ